MLPINTNNNCPSFSLILTKHKISVSAIQRRTPSPPPPPHPKSPFSQASVSITKKHLRLPLVSLSKPLVNTQFDFIQDERMVNFMMDKYIVPSFVVSLLGFLLLCIILRPRTRNYKKKDPKSSGKCDTHNVIPSNLTTGECGSEKGATATDVIIVGAGVAGAALANTLAKVYPQLLSVYCFLFFFCFFWVFPNACIGASLNPDNVCGCRSA